MSEEQKLDPRLHFVVATAIIEKGGKFLIAKRAAREIVFPNKWTVPGGKLVLSEYKNLPQKAGLDMWYNVVEWVVRKEVKEEVNLKIGKIGYVCDLTFIRPDGYPVVTLSYWARYKSGKVKLCKDLTEYAWVTLKEAKQYDLIEGIYDELRQADKLIHQKGTRLS